MKFFFANGGEGSVSEVFFVQMKGNTMMAESKMAKFNMAEFKMPPIIKLSENKRV